MPLYRGNLLFNMFEFWIRCLFWLLKKSLQVILMLLQGWELTTALLLIRCSKGVRKEKIKNPDSPHAFKACTQQNFQTGTIWKPMRTQKVGWELQDNLQLRVKTCPCGQWLWAQQAPDTGKQCPSARSGSDHHGSGKSLGISGPSGSVQEDSPSLFKMKAWAEVERTGWGMGEALERKSMFREFCLDYGLTRLAWKSYSYFITLENRIVLV